MKILYNKNDLTEFINSSNLSVVYFSASWCIPCRKIYEDIEILETIYENKIKFLKIDIDEFPRLAANYNIKHIPTFLYFKNNKFLGRVESSVLSRIKTLITILLN